jgi:3-hydroxyisobutyrate dehydrogenase-like beta-hydroxyacid dehydrogenase
MAKITKRQNCCLLPQLPKAYESLRTFVGIKPVSPETTRKVGAIVEQGGATFVDGGIIGPPARSLGSTRLYLSGPAAQQVATVF